MPSLVVRNADRRTTLGIRVDVADGPWSRLRGLLGRDALAPGEGLLLTPCRAIHMYGMRFPIDVAFLDPEGQVLAAYDSIRPGQRTRRHGDARYALEIPAGTLTESRTRIGDTLEWEVR
ncbi:MAG: DUF192 domain-containing protein [Gemmatimonadota bacterium]|nr:DUF192 domain-containing protein [Gemmatimonadota bacterium]